jgi:hypothetical protein
MLISLKIRVACCLIAAAGAGATAHDSRQPAATPAQPDSIRAAFLKMIDRPRVPLEATVRSRPESSGLVVEQISFAAEAGQRVPTLLFKRSDSGRVFRPADPAAAPRYNPGGCVTISRVAI